MRDDKRVLSGEHFGRDTARHREFIERLHGETGKCVALAGAEVRLSASEKKAIPGYDIDELTRLKKPFGLTEFGPHRASWGTMDYAAFIKTIRANYPQTTFFLPWNTGWSIVANKNGDATMDDLWIIDRDEVCWRWRRMPSSSANP